MAKTRNGKVDVHCYIEEELKADADRIFASFGLTISDAIAIFFRKCIAEGGIPFEVKMTEEQRAYIEQKYRIANARFNKTSEGAAQDKEVKKE